MAAPVEKPKDGWGTMKRLISCFRPEMPLVLLLMLIVMTGVAASVLAPSFQAGAIDNITNGQFDALPRALAVMLAAYLTGSAAAWAQEIVSAHLSQRVIKRLRTDLFRKIVRLPVRYLDTHSHGDIMSRMTNDAENISNVISQSLSSLFSGILTLIGTVAVMLRYSPQLTLLCCSTVILTFAFTRILSRYIRKYYLLRQTLLGRINGIVEEQLGCFRTVTAYGMQDRVVGDFAKVSDDLTRAGIIADVISSSVGPVMNMLNNVTFVVVAVFGAYLAVRGSITVGIISAFIIYARQFSRPINELSQLYGQIQTAAAGAERVFDVLDAPEEDASGDRPLKTTEGAIEFSHVNFSYVPGKQIIHDFSLKIESGKKIALVGSTGSGKTTIINLLMRFYDIDSGTITIDGKDIRNIALRDLRDTIGIVLQETALFTDTVRANLAYACPGASDAEVREAASDSYCDGMIESLPEKYDTVLSSSGGNLSQGQKQLLTIGRAFLSRPDILILDEATSNVDTRTEKHIQDAMIRLMEGRTSLIIAHRLSTIQDADTIVVMDQGRIVETGNHEELLARKGRYYDLYMTQFAGQAT